MEHDEVIAQIDQWARDTEVNDIPRIVMSYVVRRLDCSHEQAMDFANSSRDSARTIDLAFDTAVGDTRGFWNSIHIRPSSSLLELRSEGVDRMITQLAHKEGAPRCVKELCTLIEKHTRRS